MGKDKVQCIDDHVTGSELRLRYDTYGPGTGVVRGMIDCGSKYRRFIMNMDEVFSDDKKWSDFFTSKLENEDRIAAMWAQKNRIELSIEASIQSMSFKRNPMKHTFPEGTSCYMGFEILFTCQLRISFDNRQTWDFYESIVSSGLAQSIPWVTGKGDSA